MSKENYTSANLDRIFEGIENMMSEAGRIPLTDKIIVEESDLTEALEELRSAIPKEVGRAIDVLEEQKRIINQAYEEADRIVQMAKGEAERIVGVANAEADRLVQQEEIVKQASAVAEDIKASALSYQQEVKQEADEYAELVKNDSLKYVDEMFAYLGGNLQSALQSLSETREGIMHERQKMLNRALSEAEVQEEEMVE